MLTLFLFKTSTNAVALLVRTVEHVAMALTDTHARVSLATMVPTAKQVSLINYSVMHYV